MMAIVVALCLLVVGAAAWGSPRGWDSYDSNPIWFNASIRESDFLAQARILASFTGPDGTPSFPYAVIDEGWAEDETGGWILDDYARPTVNPNLFPSANAGQGFRPLQQKLSALGLKLGLWLIKGIPKMAVDLDLPIMGTPYTARDIAIPDKSCVWHKDMLYVNVSHPGGQAYYDSLAQLYSTDWGVDYIKMDCIFGADLDGPEIAAVSTAFKRRASTEVLSLSPGTDATPALGAEYGNASNIYRITDDLWDCWSYAAPVSSTGCVGGVSVINSTRRIVEFARANLLALPTHMNNGAMIGVTNPDPDMLAFGLIRLKSVRPSLFTAGMKRYMFGLWTITQSPLILGGELQTFAPDLVQLLSAPLMYSAHQLADRPVLVEFVDTTEQLDSVGHSVWAANHSNIAAAFFYGVFPTANDPTSSAALNCSDVAPPPYPSSAITLYDVIDAATNAKITTLERGASVPVTIPRNDGRIFLFLPRAV